MFTTGLHEKICQGVLPDQFGFAQGIPENVKDEAPGHKRKTKTDEFCFRFFSLSLCLLLSSACFLSFSTLILLSEVLLAQGLCLPFKRIPFGRSFSQTD